MSANWVRTSAALDYYGYVATVERDGDRWHWRVWRHGDSRCRADGWTKRETSARTAARRWILAQPDAAAAYAIDAMVHWNGRPFDGSEHGYSSWRNHDSSSGDWRGACGATTGYSTNYINEREKVNCPRCAELLAASEQQKAQAAP